MTIQFHCAFACSSCKRCRQTGGCCFLKLVSSCACACCKRYRQACGRCFCELEAPCGVSYIFFPAFGTGGESDRIFSVPTRSTFISCACDCERCCHSGDPSPSDHSVRDQDETRCRGFECSAGARASGKIGCCYLADILDFVFTCVCCCCSCPSVVSSGAATPGQYSSRSAAGPKTRAGRGATVAQDDDRTTH